MTIGVLKEPDFENRVSLLPETAKALLKLKVDFLIEKNAGTRASALNNEYTEIGAKIADRDEVIKNADLLLSINTPVEDTLKKLKKGQVVISVFDPLSQKKLLDQLLKSEQTYFSMDLISKVHRRCSFRECYNIPFRSKNHNLG